MVNSFRSNKFNNNNLPNNPPTVGGQMPNRGIAFRNNDYVAKSGSQTIGGYNDILNVFLNLGIQNPMQRAKNLNLSIDAFLSICIDSKNLKIQPEEYYNVLILMKKYNMPFKAAYQFYFESLNKAKEQQINNTNEYISNLANNFLILMEYEALNNNIDIDKYIQLKFKRAKNEIINDLNFLKSYVEANSALLNEILENEYAENAINEEAKQMGVDTAALCKIRYGKSYDEVLMEKIMEFRGINNANLNANCTCEGVVEQNQVQQSVQQPAQQQEVEIVESVDINQSKVNNQYEKPVFGSMTENGIKQGISFGQQVDKQTRKTYGNTETKVDVNSCDNKNFYN